MVGPGRSARILLRIARYCCRRRSGNGLTRRPIRVTGMGNVEADVRRYPSGERLVWQLPALRRGGAHDGLLAINFLHDEFVDSRKPKVFCALEPLPLLSERTLERMSLPALAPHLYLYDHPDVRRRMFYPAMYGDRRPLLRARTRGLGEKRPGLCCIVNRWAEREPRGLLSHRIEFARALAHGIDIYGAEPWSGANGWRGFPTYRGPVRDKLATLRRYDFVLAFENTDWPGYITEKIIHAFMTGAVPLYWGGGAHAKQVLPDDAYVDCRGQAPEDVARRIRAMSHEEIVGYRRAGLRFLASPMADRFTWRSWATEIARSLAAQERQRGSASG